MTIGLSLAASFLGPGGGDKIIMSRERDKKFLASFMSALGRPIV